MDEKQAKSVVTSALKEAESTSADIKKLMSPPQIKKPQSPEVRFEQLKDKVTKMAEEITLAKAMYPLVVDVLKNTLEKAADEGLDLMDVFYDHADVVYNDDMPQRIKRRQLAGEADSIDVMGRMRPTVLSG